MLDLVGPAGRADEPVELVEVRQQGSGSRRIEGAELVGVVIHGRLRDRELVGRRGVRGRVRRLVVDRHQLERGERGPDVVLQRLELLGLRGLAALELVAIHYESTNATTRAAAADQLAVARTTVEEHTDELRALDAAKTAALLADLDELDGLVRTTGRADEVEQATSDAAEQLRRLARLD